MSRGIASPAGAEQTRRAALGYAGSLAANNVERRPSHPPGRSTWPTPGRHCHRLCCASDALTGASAMAKSASRPLQHRGPVALDVQQVCLPAEHARLVAARQVHRRCPAGESIDRHNSGQPGGGIRQPSSSTPLSMYLVHEEAIRVARRLCALARTCGESSEASFPKCLATRARRACTGHDGTGHRVACMHADSGQGREVCRRKHSACPSAATYRSLRKPELQIKPLRYGHSTTCSAITAGVTKKSASTRADRRIALEAPHAYRLASQDLTAFVHMRNARIDAVPLRMRSQG